MTIAVFSPFGGGAALDRFVGNSHYNALQTKMTKRFAHGLQVQGAYTWSHAIDDVQDPLNPTARTSNFPVSSRKLFEEHGNSNFDIHHRVVINYVYELPVGKGKNFLSIGVLGAEDEDGLVSRVRRKTLRDCNCATVEGLTWIRGFGEPQIALSPRHFATLLGTHVLLR